MEFNQVLVNCRIKNKENLSEFSLLFEEVLPIFLQSAEWKYRGFQNSLRQNNFPETYFSKWGGFFRSLKTTR